MTPRMAAIVLDSPVVLVFVLVFPVFVCQTRPVSPEINCWTFGRTHHKISYEFSIIRTNSSCQWITSFLTDRQQLVRLGKYTSSTRTVSTGTPQGCVLSPLLFSPYTNDCTSKDPSVKLLKFADDTTVIGLTGWWRVCLQTGCWTAGCLVLTTWSSTRSRQWRWSWTSGETPLLSPHSPSWTAL